jgi:hypothetical protein
MDSEISEISDQISDPGSEPLVTVDGFGSMTKKQALQTTINYLRQMAEKLEQGIGIPMHYFDMAKDHYRAVMGESQHPPV